MQASMYGGYGGYGAQGGQTGECMFSEIVCAYVCCCIAL